VIPARPAGLRREYWTPKRLAILIGFVLAVLSTLGPQFYVGPVEDFAAEADRSAKSLAARIETLRGARSQYLTFQQIGVLIYALNATGLAAQGSSQHDTLSKLYELSLVDRSGAVRQVIGELAKAKKLDYRATSDSYGELIAAARKDVGLATYKAVDDFEAATMMRVNDLMAELQKAMLAVEEAKGMADALASRRRLHMLVVTALGSTLLLAANLMSEKPAAPPAGPPQSLEETEAAERLVRLALDAARALPPEPAKARPEQKS